MMVGLLAGYTALPAVAVLTAGGGSGDPSPTERADLDIDDITGVRLDGAPVEEAEAESEGEENLDR